MRPVVTFLVCSFVLAPTLLAEDAPEARRLPSFELSEAAMKLIEPIPRRDLGDDEYFLSTLGRVLEDSSLTSSAKVDAFYLMLRKIGWEFTGTVRIFPDTNYLRTFAGMATTYLAYQDFLSSRAEDPGPFLEIATTQCETHVVRCSHALLLASMLHAERSRPAILKAIDLERVRSVSVPAIYIHHVAFAIVLSHDESLALALASLLPEISEEESQEDILASLSAFRSSDVASATRQFFERASAEKLDKAVEMSILILRIQLPAAEFEAVYRGAIERIRAAERRDRLIALGRDGFAELESFGPGQGWLKSWDGFSLAMYDDGILVAYGDSFWDFKPN